MTRKKIRHIAIWFLIGAIGLALIGIMYGFEQKFFVRGAWWTMIYVGISLAVCGMSCYEHKDDE
jgi:hypothetical membrane protein